MLNDAFQQDKRKRTRNTWFGFGRSFVLNNFFNKQNWKCMLNVQRKKYFFQDIFGEKPVNVIVNDVEGLATTPPYETFYY